MGWLIGIAIAGLVVGGGAAVVSGIQKDQELENQKKAQEQKEKNDAIGYIGTDATTLQENLSAIQQYLETISGLESEISANEYNAGVNNEWLADYQAMLAGTADRNNVLNNTLTELNAKVDEATGNLTEAQNNLALSNTALGLGNTRLDLANASKTEAENALGEAQTNLSLSQTQLELQTGAKTLAERVLQQRQNESATYLQTAALQKEASVNQGYTSYAEMMKQKSLANVVAGSTGSVKGAYSSAALVQENNIRKYVGSDLKFNQDGNFDTASSGAFAREFSVLTAQINDQISLNNISILSAQADVSSAQYNIDAANAGIQSAQNAITTATNNIATAEYNINAANADIEQLTASVTAAENDVTAASNAKVSAENAVTAKKQEWETQKESLENQNADWQKANELKQKSITEYATTVALLQNNAISALQDYKKYAKTAGKSDKEIEDFEKQYKDAYKNIGYAIA